MGRDIHGGSPKVVQQLESQRRRLTYIFGVSLLCMLSYVLGSWQNNTVPKADPSAELASKVNCDTTTTTTQANSPPSSAIDPSSVSPDVSVVLDFEVHHKIDVNDTSSSVQTFPACAMNFSEYTPCEDRNRGRRFEREMLVYRERHCPGPDEMIRCLIPAPPKYKRPLQWPKSRDHSWFDNIPHKELTIEKAHQNWIQLEGQQFHFPGGGTMFLRGADAYIDDLSALIPLTDGSIRTALDTGCGVASFGAYLLKRDILTMSFAPRDTHEAQVWFALERGVPAMIGVMGSLRTPYPARSFDMAHCSRCLIKWAKHDGLYLAEIDRILRPGGYWVLSGPPINWMGHYKGWQRSREDLKQEQDTIEEAAKNLCWKKLVEKGDHAVWQKPVNHLECVASRKTADQKLQMCSNAGVADAAWYTKLEACITPLPEVGGEGEIAGGELKKWPERAFAVPPRISSGSVQGVDTKKFEEDNTMWKERISYYKRLVMDISLGRYRNVMDMNAYLGGFAAAMAKFPVWVMNVVPVDADANTLGVIYERGFIGTYQDWCEAFSTYPRSYDLIHADCVFSMYKDKCEMEYILLEMDRILRPEGRVIFRDTAEVLARVKEMVEGMRWTGSHIRDHETGPMNPQKILVATKSYWTGEAVTLQRKQQ